MEDFDLSLIIPWKEQVNEAILEKLIADEMEVER